eukprot:m.212501 g.212501  ORF g.212501 m.212501 type:complete len:746 (+) comp19045_c0_seq4:182-2419(+)
MMASPDPLLLEDAVHDSPAFRNCLNAWTKHGVETRKSVALVHAALNNYVKAGHEHQERTVDLMHALQQGSKHFTVRDPTSGTVDEPLERLSEALAQVAEHQKMLLNQMKALTIEESASLLAEFETIASSIVALKDKDSARKATVNKFCHCSPTMVDSAGTTADEEFVKRGRRAFVAQRSHTLGNIEIVQRYHRVETLSKPSFLKRMSEQVFMFHAFFKQGSAAFDELQPDAMSIFSNLGEYTERVKAEKAKHASDVSMLQHATEVRYSADMQSLPAAVRKHTGETMGGGGAPTGRTVGDDGDTPPSEAAPDKGFGATMKRLRQSAKAKMAELNERRLHGSVASSEHINVSEKKVPPVLTSVAPDDVTNAILQAKGGKQGWVLRRERGIAVTSWKPVFLRVANDLLVEVCEDGTSEQLCNLALLNVKHCMPASVDRLACLDLITPNMKMCIQARCVRDAAEWFLILTHGSVSAIQSGSAGVGMSSEQRVQLAAVAGNSSCADCESPDPEWASINLGILLCLKCSGAHRALGVNHSKVRSVTLDAWPDEVRKAMLEVGNATSNAHFEALMKTSPSEASMETPQGSPKPTGASSQDDIQAFVRAKYVDQRWVRAGSKPPCALSSVMAPPPVEEESADDAARADGSTAVVLEADTTEAAVLETGAVIVDQGADGVAAAETGDDSGGAAVTPTRLKTPLPKTPSAVSMMSVDLSTPAGAQIVSEAESSEDISAKDVGGDIPEWPTAEDGG